MSQPSVKKNYIYNIAYQVLSILTPFITAPYVSRILGADGIGIYSYTSSILAYFTMFSVLGTTQYGIREIARLRDDKNAMSKAFWEIQVIILIATSICTSAWIGLTFSNEFYFYYFLALTPSLIGTALDISWLFIGLEKVGYTVLRNTICKFVGIACLFIFVREKDDLVLYILLNSLITFLGNLSMWTYLPKTVTKVSLKSMRFHQHIKETFTYFVITIAISLYTVLDKVLIGLITQDSYQNGYYEQANKIITIAKTLSFAALNGVMGARLSYLYAQNKLDEIRSRIENSIDYIFLIGFCFIFGICSVAKNFVPVFFGEGYEPVVGLLCLMTPLIFFISISTALGSHYYLPSGRIKKSTQMTIIGSIVNLCANMLLIPIFGAIGAVIGSLIGEGLIAIIYAINARSIFLISNIAKYSYKRLFAGILMVVTSYIVDKYLYSSKYIILASQMLVSIVVYFGTLILMHDRMVQELYTTIVNKIKR